MDEDAASLIDEVTHRPAWHARAACRGMGTDAFFPERGGSIDAATAVCEGCTVRDDCLSAALAVGDCRGIWGGLSAKGRKVLRRVVA